MSNDRIILTEFINQKRISDERIRQSLDTLDKVSDSIADSDIDLKSFLKLHSGFDFNALDKALQSNSSKAISDCQVRTSEVQNFDTGVSIGLCSISDSSLKTAFKFYRDNSGIITIMNNEVLNIKYL